MQVELVVLFSQKPVLRFVYIFIFFVSLFSVLHIIFLRMSLELFSVTLIFLLIYKVLYELQAYFPHISHSEGLPLRVQDVKGNEWTFQFRFWPNNNSRMYVLEGVTPCIQAMELRAGDTGMHQFMELHSHTLVPL